MKYVASVLFSALFLVSTMVGASPVHSHCDIKSWGPIASSETYPALPADYRASGNAEKISIFEFSALLNAPPPPSSVPKCNYEISDVTQVEVRFTFEGTMSWDKVLFQSSEGWITIDPADPISFVSGESKYFQFEPHLGGDQKIPGPIEMIMPSNQYYVEFIGDNNAFKVTNASLKLNGNHYYIPEPSTLLLFSIAFLVILKRKSKGIWVQVLH